MATGLRATLRTWNLGAKSIAGIPEVGFEPTRPKARVFETLESAIPPLWRSGADPPREVRIAQEWDGSLGWRKTVTPPTSLCQEKWRG